ncbi:MAG: Gfo/Idh/MocA family oxidoreductase [Verrucomicrobia bacterium]|nr:Gfo/Idh/MocA family oxidoreductase [Verrucomicrobiota bacterium]
MTEVNRRSFLKTSVLAGGYLGAMGMSARSYAAVRGANDRVRVGIVGFSDRFKSSLLPAFTANMKSTNFDIVALSDLWSVRREDGKKALTQAVGHDIAVHRNNEELYATAKDLDAVIISTADFQHALHTVEAVQAGMDTYTEKPLAETMADARAVLTAVKETRKIVQIGSQRRSGRSYHAAAEFIQTGRFGPIAMVDLMWNVNQPGRWRRPDLVASIRESDTDWKRYLMNRPSTPWDPRKYLEYRLFWPFSSGIGGQWMCHQIDTVHWFSKLEYPRSVAVNGGIYQWKDGRTNADTLTAVFDYGPPDDLSTGFQVLFRSRFSNSAGGVKEIYYSNGGTIDLDKGTVSPEGGLTLKEAAVMKLPANQLPDMKLGGDEKVEAGANTGGDVLTLAHMRNWMDCVRSRKQPNAPIEAGFSHSIATIMTNAAYRTGQRAVYDPGRKEVVAGGKVFKY